jgi:hypothetical protein
MYIQLNYDEVINEPKLWELKGLSKPWGGGRIGQPCCSPLEWFKEFPLSR